MPGGFGLGEVEAVSDRMSTDGNDVPDISGPDIVALDRQHVWHPFGQEQTAPTPLPVARAAGALKVYFASAAPPVRYPNVYGIDMPTPDELVAHNRTVDEIRISIGCDALIYQDVDAMKQAIASLNPGLAGFDASCFDGVYVTGDITLEDIARMNAGRDQSEETEEDTSRLALPNAQTA